MKVLNQLPNTLTLLNLMCGTIGIMAIYEHNTMLALILVGGSLVADILDGAIARRLGVSGGLGIQLDSLADVVSFGVLPSMMMYNLNAVEGDASSNCIYMIITSFIAVSAGLRLARFNVDTRPREFFWGLPTPAGGILVAGWAWANLVNPDSGIAVEWMHAISIAICLLLAIVFQVSLKLPSFKSPKPGLYTAIGIGVLAVAGLIFVGPIFITLGIVAYILAGVVNMGVRWF